jgi:hypothetical protein
VHRDTPVEAVKSAGGFVKPSPPARLAALFIAARRRARRF